MYGPEDVGAAHLEADGDELDALAVQLVAQCLPPGQVHAAASIGRPRDEDDLLAPQRRQGELVAVEVGQHQLGRFRGRQRTPADGLRADSPQAEVLVVHHRHAEPVGSVGEAEPVGQGDADLAFARALRLDLPTGGREGLRGLRPTSR